MFRNVPRRVALIALPLLLVVLAGCAPEPAATTPSPSPSVSAPATATSTPTEEPIAQVDRISLSATELTLWSGDEEVESLSTDAADIAATVAGIGAILGEPEIETVGEEPSECALPSVVYSWGEELRVLDYSENGGGVWSIATVRILATEVTAVDGSTIGLEASTGTAVGDDVSQLITQTPDAAKEGYEYEGVTTVVVLVDEDPRFAGDAGMWGLAVVAKDGIATTIGIPFSVGSGADC
jgi:hypothetical protein